MQELPNTESADVTVLALAHSMVKQAETNVIRPSEKAEEKLDRLLEAFEKAYQKVYDAWASRG